VCKAGEKKTVCKVGVKYVRQMVSRERVKLAEIESVMWMGSRGYVRGVGNRDVKWTESRECIRWERM
jgi:hypothetical protein